MKRVVFGLFWALVCGLTLSGCLGAGTGNQVILLGESTIPGSDAVGEVNRAIQNAKAAGCNAISVGGYGLAIQQGLEGRAGSLIGVPVLVECPAGVTLLPTPLKPS